MTYDRRYDEIVSFQKAVASGDFARAEIIIQNAKYASSERIVTWRWQIKAKKNDVDLLELYDIIAVSNFPLSLLYVYFEVCLDRLDLLNFDRMHLSYSRINCDTSSPIYFDVIGNFFHSKMSDEESKKVSRALYTGNRKEFIEYLK